MIIVFFLVFILFIVCYNELSLDQILLILKYCSLYLFFVKEKEEGRGNIVFIDKIVIEEIIWLDFFFMICLFYLVYILRILILWFVFKFKLGIMVRVLKWFLESEYYLILFRVLLFLFIV